ncbi:hypothetical protein ACS0TY_015356 [Phlomoides rotata]
MMPQKLGSFLLCCSKTKEFRRGLPFHAAVIKSGAQADVIIGNHILNFYAKCGRINFAHQVFDEMTLRNLVTWSALISGYDQSNKPHFALRVFSQMHEHFKPNEFVFASALSSCACMKHLKLGQQIHAQALKLNRGYSVFVLNSLTLMYMKCGACADALSIFDDSKHDSSTLVSYNVVITGLVENKQLKMGIEMFNVMCQQGLVPDRFTFAGLLTPSEPIYDLSLVMQLHCLIAKLGLDCTAFSGNVLITLYSKFNLIDETLKAFRTIIKRDVVSWTTAISALCRCENNSKALDVFREMMDDHNVCPDCYTYASVLSSAAGLTSLRIGKEIHGHLIRTRSDWDIGVCNALINMYAKSGSISSSCIVFEHMEIRNLISWNTMISGFANHGLAEKAIALFEEMMRTGLKPDCVTFLELLTACNHSGLANEGQVFFSSMSEVYGITPSIEHLCCLIDLLGRAGRVTEAEEYAYNYYVGDDAVVLGSLLSASRLHEGVSAGEQIAKKLVQLRPVSSSPYVLLSNLYASNRKWDGVLGARKLLQVSGLKKGVARSLINVKGSVEEFIVGDFSHFRMDDILNMLDTLNRMKDEDLLFS